MVQQGRPAHQEAPGLRAPLGSRAELGRLALWVLQGVLVSRECRDKQDLRDSVA